MVDKGTIGRLGEDAAAAWLEDHGYHILERNWRHGRYEVDVIAVRDGGLHIVEVKCRRDRGLTSPQDAYTPAKFAALQKAAATYIENKGVDADCHFDLASVTHGGGRFEVDFMPDVMSPGW